MMVDPSTAAAGLTAAGKAASEVLAVKQEENKRRNGVLLEDARAQPAFQKAVVLYGENQAAKQAILRGLYAPFKAMAGAVTKYFEDDFSEDLGAKVNQIPAENLQAPRANVAMPAIQGLSASLDEPDLKEMYLNLLAAASDSSIAESAHPAFAEIIKQLSSAEAACLRSILRTTNTPSVRLHLQDVEPPNNYTVEVRHILPFCEKGEEDKPISIPYLATYVDNWVRLGLVTTDYGGLSLGADGAYSWVEFRPEIEISRSLYNTDQSRIEIVRGLVSTTAFGAQFYKAVGLPAQGT